MATRSTRKRTAPGRVETPASTTSADDALRAARAAAAPAPVDVPTVLNPEAIGDPEATPVVQLPPSSNEPNLSGLTVPEALAALEDTGGDITRQSAGTIDSALEATTGEVPLAGETAESTRHRLDDWRAVESIRVTADEDTDDTDRAYFVRLVLAELSRRLPASAVAPAVAHAAVALDEAALATIDETFPEERPHLVLAPSWNDRAQVDE